MKTLKRLKVLTRFQILYCICCLLSCVCWWVYDAARSDWTLFLGILSMYGWCFNPIGPITLVMGLRTYLQERRNLLMRERIGIQWIWFLIWPVIDTVLYVVSAGMMVEVTGGV